MTETTLAARVLSRMRERGNATFASHDICHLAGLDAHQNVQANVLAHRMVKDGALVRVAHGLYALADRPVAPIHLFLWQVNANHFQLSHRTAMAIHGFGPPLPHATLMVTVDEAKRPRPFTEGVRLQFIKRPARLHGQPHRVEVPGVGVVPVADPETTLLEGLTSPELCGGFLEVCRYLAFRRDMWDAGKLVERARKHGLEVLLRRAGLLLEWADAPAARELPRPHSNAQGLWLDPGSRRIGKTDPHWRLRLNVQREQVLEALGKAEAASSAW